MKIQYLGHSCFRIISQMGTAVICDPYKSQMVGLEMPQVSCDIVTVSHRHDDHCAVDEVAGNPAVLEKEVYLAADDIAVQSIKCWHDDKKGKLRGENFVFCFLVDGLKVVHLGDVGELNQTLASQIYGCDVLLLPVGGVYTVDAVGAKWYVDHACPKIVIPMHYGTERHKFHLGSVEEFTRLFDPKQVKLQHSETLNLDDQPENTQPQIVVLDIYRD